MATAALPGPSMDANATVRKWTACSKPKDDRSGTMTDDNNSFPVLEDDMILGAEAGHLDGGRPKTLTQCLCKGKMTHMDSVSSDGSRYSIDQLLHDRKPDPEEMLRNLGFTAGSKTESRRRVPVRFLQSPSHAKGICLEQLMKINPELKECIEASKALMTPQGNGGHMTTISFKTVTNTMRMLTRFAQMHKAPPQETSAPKNHIEPMEITSPDGYKYMTILDPENARYLDQQGHYKLSRQDRFNKMPDIESPVSSPDQMLPCEVDKTPLKSTAICNEKEGKHEREEGEGEGEKAVMLRRRLELVESNKENINLHFDLNANLQPQPVTQLPWQPAGCLMRPIAQNRGAVLTHFLQRSLSQKCAQSKCMNTDTSPMQISKMDGEHSRKEQRRDVVDDVVVERLDVSGAALEIKMDELSDDSIGEEGTDEQSLMRASVEEESSGSPNTDIDQSDVCLVEDDGDMPRGAGDGNSEQSEEATCIPNVGWKTPEEERGGTTTSCTKEKQLLYRRANWQRSNNFTIQVEPEETVASEGLNQLNAYMMDADGARRVPLLRDNSSQPPSFEMEVQSSDEDVVDESLPVFKRETSKGSLVRTGSGQSDSSGFIELDEESETTASFARDSSKDSVMESHTGSSGSSCTLCGSLDRDMRSSLEHDGRSSPELDGQYSVECSRCSLQDNDLMRYSPSSSAVQNLDSVNNREIVTTTTSDHHDNATSSSVINGTEPQQVTLHDGHMDVESNDTISVNVPWGNTLAEVSKMSRNQLPLSSQTQSQTHVSHTLPMTRVIDPQSPCHECREKPMSSITDAVMQLPGLGDNANVYGQDILEEPMHLKEEVQQSPHHLEEEAQEQRLAYEARQAQHKHLVDEVKQVQQAVLGYKSSLQGFESQSTEIMSTCISEQSRDELRELQQLRSDIFQEVVKLEHLLAVRMRLVIAGAGVQLQVSHTNHEHIVLPMIELLKEQTNHRSIINTIISQQSITRSPDGSDTMVDMTTDDINQTCQRSDNVPPYQMMFGQAMDELKVALLTDIRSTIHSEMEPLRRQMQEFGNRLKKLESAVTNSQVVAPLAGAQHDNGVT